MNGIAETTKKIIQKKLARFGYEIRAIDKHLYGDYFNQLYLKVKPYTMTSRERVASIVHSIKYIVKNNIQGSIVECGVYKGGSTLAAIEALKNENCFDRDVYLYDTFEGMTSPSKNDIDLYGTFATKRFEKLKINPSSSNWLNESLDNVKKLIQSSGYNMTKVFFVQGDVLKTIPKTTPNKIALLRLDTDWYESTKHELVHLFPLLSKNGILIIDDYGHWEGSKKATDEYFETLENPIFLYPIDYSGRIGIKT
jgi:predicted O-methyltransferase YrrM